MQKLPHKRFLYNPDLIGFYFQLQKGRNLLPLFSSFILLSHFLLNS
ncbi:hypothetical protein S3E15_05639 [Bacillus mycoides]|uniref:Uncharacterized protein n=1 Tax=Bacillus mycoides TaxID=1405 RepID=A0AAP7W8F4_BACMY|nr:hypothetical protein S3E15_05639 [Bacillus mycoides]